MSAHEIRGMRLYRQLLRLYPSAFRRRFETEMTAMFAEASATAGTSSSARLALWRTVLSDLLRSAWRERFPERIGGMGELAYDARQAWRNVTRAPLLGAFVVLLMALSIGSTTAIFSIVNAVLLRPLPLADPDRLVMIWERRGAEVARNPVGGHEYPEWQARSRSFAEMGAVAFDREYNLTGTGEPLTLVSPRVTSGFLRVMGVTPQLGRIFTPDEDLPGRGRVAVISDALWRGRFNADPAIVNRTILLSGEPFSVVGVMPPDFQFPPGPGGTRPDIWTPIAEPIHLYRGRHYLFVVGRLKPGVAIEAAQSEMDAIAAGIATELPSVSKGHGASVRPLHGELVLDVRPALLVLFAAVVLVLLIGCCNVANLLLARAAARQQEMAVRVALGAGRLRLARQLLAEGGVFAICGGTGGALLAAWLIAVATSIAPGDVPRLQTARLDGASLAFAATVSILTALLFGLVPLAQLARVQVAERLKHGSKGSVRPVRQPLRRALVIVEVALTLIVAVSAGLLLQSFNRLLHVDPGFDAGGVTAVDLSLPSTRYRAAASQSRFVEDALARIEGLPGVTAAAATNFVPQGSGYSGIPIGIEGRPLAKPGEEAMAGYRVVTPQYFEALGIPILAGRGFTTQDARVAVPLIRWFAQQPQPTGFDVPQAPPVAVVNQTMARQYWPGVDPVGRRFTALFSPAITVIGVVKDSRNRALAERPEPEFYLSVGQEPQSKVTLLVRARESGGALPAGLRAAIWAIDRDLPISNVRTLEDIVNGNLSLFRGLTSLVSGFALIALVLTTLGIYAVISYTTAQRTYEIGVRLALGAQRRDIRHMVVVNGIGLTLAGIAVGIGGAYALARYASQLLYEVQPSDPFTYAALSTVVLAVAMVATWLPARRAQRVDPVTVLRNE